MINKLTIENLKCFGEKTEIDLAPLTLLYGENSGGKSTILLALRLLQSIHRGDTGSIPFSDIVSRHDIARNITLGFRCHINGRSNQIEAVEWKATMEWCHETKQPRLKRMCASRSFEDIPLFEFKLDNQCFSSSFILELSHSEVDKLRRMITNNAKILWACIDRLIEAKIMQEYLLLNPTVGEEVYSALIKADSIEPNRSELPAIKMGSAAEYDFFDKLEKKLNLANALPPPANDVFARLEKRNTVIRETERHEASKRIQQWREGVPEWVKVCPPGWAEYRESDGFTTAHAQLRASEFCEVLRFCNNPETANLNRFLAHGFIDGGFTSRLCFDDTPLNHLLTALGDPAITIERCQTGRCPVRVSCTIRSELPTPYIRAVEQAIGSTQAEWVYRFNAAKEVVQSVLCIAPLRDPAQRNYSFAASDGSAPFRLVENKDNLRQRVNTWLKRLGVEYTVDIRRSDLGGIFQVVLQDSRNLESPSVNYADVGFGISQILPILVAGLAGENSIILIEQPELHIHPRLQAELGSFFAECIKERGHQFIIETHSEHIMLRIQRLLRQKKLGASDVAVRYVSRSDNGSNIQELRIADAGDLIDPWPGGFFPERFKELLNS